MLLFRAIFVHPGLASSLALGQSEALAGDPVGPSHSDSGPMIHDVSTIICPQSMVSGCHPRATEGG